MPTAAKRQKLSVSTSRTAPSSNSGTGGIGAYAHLSKASTAAKTIIDKDHSVEAITTTCYKESAKACKRRFVEDSNIEDSTTQSRRRNIKTAVSIVSKSHFALPKTLCKQIWSDNASSIANVTPCKGAASINGLKVISNPTTPPSSSSTFSSSPIDTSAPIKNLYLPGELIDLTDLHAAFLTALSLHYAYNGATSPADLRMLCPVVARAWGKRRVTVDDIRRSLGIMNISLSTSAQYCKLARLSLSDYGQGKICVEIRMGRAKADNMVKPIDEDLMNDIFVEGLTKEWRNRNPITMEVKQFTTDLPMEPVLTCSSLAKISPLLAKGQRRLEDMKTCITKKQSSSDINQKTVDASGAQPTLLERLRAKQLHQLTLPAPPTRQQQARKAALQRLEEVVAVLSVLSTSTSIGQSRVSFTMRTILSKLKDSSRRALSKEEGECCVRVLASEIAPEWIRVMKLGKVEVVVVMREQKPSDLDIRKRIGTAA